MLSPRRSCARAQLRTMEGHAQFGPMLRSDILPETEHPERFSDWNITAKHRTKIGLSGGRVLRRQLPVEEAQDVLAHDSADL